MNYFMKVFLVKGNPTKVDVWSHLNGQGGRKYMDVWSYWSQNTHSKKIPQRMLSSWLLHRRHIHLGNTSTVNDKMYCLCDYQ